MKPKSRAMTSACLLLTLLLIPVSSHEATTAAANKEARIRELMRITGAANIGIQMMTTMIGSMKQAMPKVPEEFWNRMIAETKVDELEDMVIPIYSDHFTTAEINQIIAFYSTPTGKKVISEMPGVVQESMAAGQKWGEGLARKVGAQLEKEGYKMD